MTKYEGVFSFIGGIFIIAALGNILPFSTMNYYLTQEGTKEIISWKGLMLFSLLLCSANIINILSLSISSAVGPQLLSIMGFILSGGGYSLFYLYNELSMHYIGVALIGCGTGIQFNPVIRNVWLYNPGYKAIISIIYLLVYGISSVSITFFSEQIFSSDDKKMTTSSEKRIFCFGIILVMSSCSGIFGILLTSNYNNDNNTLQEDSTDILLNHNLLIEGSINDYDDDEDPFFNMKYPSENSEGIPFWPVFCLLYSFFRFWLIILMYMLAFFFCSYYSFYLRFIGFYNKYDQDTITIALLTYFISIAISRVIVCFLYPFIQFKIFLSLILIAQISIGVLDVHISNDSLYLVYTAIAGFCYAGITSIFSPLIVKMCGNEHSFEFGGIVNAFGSLSSFIIPVTLFLFENIMKDKEALFELFSYGSCCTSFCALVLCLLLNTTPFDFSHLKESNQQIEYWKESTIDKNQSLFFIDKSFFTNSEFKKKTKI